MPLKLDQKTPTKLTWPTESRIMPSHEGFVQAYSGQAAVDVDSMFVVTATLTQQTNDKQ